MNILDVSTDSELVADAKWMQITISLVVNPTVEQGKLDVSPRWKAMGKQLIRQNDDLPQDMNLVSVDAGLPEADRGFWSQKTQEFQLSFVLANGLISSDRI